MSPQLSDNQAANAIASSLHRIANCLEAAEKRARKRDEVIDNLDPESMSALLLWKDQVANTETVLGFSEWLAWHNAQTE